MTQFRTLISVLVKLLLQLPRYSIEQAIAYFEKDSQISASSRDPRVGVCRLEAFHQET